jgi:hypothetical protein
MKPMDLAGFEARYQAEGDPWGYLERDYEREKYDATLSACGPGPFAHALELGASIGVFSGRLAARARRLTTIDFAPTAVAEARERLAGQAHVDVRLGRLPGDLPSGRYDLVVASEILYYLDPAALTGTLAGLEPTMLPGARLVAVHWRPAGPDRPTDAENVHRTLARLPWLRVCEQGGSDEYRLDVLERR